jgi:hypothetical protein
LNLYRSLVAILADAVAAEIAESALLFTGSERDPAKSAAFRFAVAWHRLRKYDDAMIRRSPRRMTISELKRAMDRRFDRLERTKAGKAEFRKLQRAMDRRFERLERTKVGKSEFRRVITELKRAMGRRFDRLERTTVDKTALARSAAETRRYVDASAESLRTSLRNDIADSAAETRQYVDATAGSLRSSLGNDIASAAAETRRHFDVVAESIRAEMRLFADPIGNHTDRLNQHETRITRLERRSN